MLRAEFFPLKEKENEKNRTNYIGIYKMSIGQFNQPFDDWKKMAAFCGWFILMPSQNYLFPAVLLNNLY